jgi:hypothetical protein
MLHRLSKEDRKAIAEAVAVVAADNPGMSSSIVSCRLNKDGCAAIRTGVRRGPRDGAGQSLEAVHINGKWHVKYVGGWRS